MRVLILGAGAVGGYFGGRLVEKGENITFLVRPQRKQQLLEKGLLIHSTNGDGHVTVQAITTGEKVEPFDVVVIGVKSYHLEQALKDLRPYVHDKTMVLPLLNGITHLDRLQEFFQPSQVLGGLCFIESTLNKQGEVEQFGSRHDVILGELNGSESKRVNRLYQVFEGARLNVKKSQNIIADMWQKYLFISTFSGMTSLMNSNIGTVLEAEYGREITRKLLEESVHIARYREPRLDEGIAEQVLTVIEGLHPTMKSSMLRDIEKRGEIEADHLFGKLIQMAPDRIDFPLLKTVYTFLQVYQRKRV